MDALQSFLDSLYTKAASNPVALIIAVLVLLVLVMIFTGRRTMKWVFLVGLPKLNDTWAEQIEAQRVAETDRSKAQREAEVERAKADRDMHRDLMTAQLDTFKQIHEEQARTSAARHEEARGWHREQMTGIEEIKERLPESEKKKGG